MLQEDIEIRLIPYPKKLIRKEGFLKVESDGIIFFDEVESKNLAILLREVLSTYGRNYTIRSSNKKLNTFHIVLKINSDIVSHAQGYKILIDDSVTMVGNDKAGLFYAIQTFKQLLRLFGFNLPKLVIEDYPDFVNRGIMIDISRDRIPKIETFEYIIEKLSEMKINQLQLYFEHTFAYTNHKEVWEGYSPLTHDEVIYLDKYCKERFIELVPNQNTFGHMSKWLVHRKYRALAEAPDGYVTPWGTKYEYPFSLSPAVHGSIKLVEELLDELLPLFESNQVNIGCDETFDLGVGKSKEICEKQGKAKVYFDFLMKIYKIAKKHKKSVMFWGDIIENHPEFIPLLPKDMIPMVWGYEYNHPFDKKCELYYNSGLSFYVCPGTSTWNTFIGRSDNAIKNIKSAVLNGKEFGAIGVLTTDWGDNGHVQHLPLSWIGYSYSAHLSWNTTDLDIQELLDAIDKHIFESKNIDFSLSKMIYELGTVYSKLPYTPNGTPFFYAFIYPESAIKNWDAEMLKQLKDVSDRIDEIKEKLASCTEEKILSICEQVINNISFAQIGLALIKLILKYEDIWKIPESEWNKLVEEFYKTIDEYKNIWNKYNRSGGLEESIFKLSRFLRVRQADLRGLIF